MSSTGSSSSPPSSAGTTPCTPSGHFMPQTKKNKFEFFADAEQAAAGNIFRHRTDLAAFGTLPRHLQVSRRFGWFRDNAVTRTLEHGRNDTDIGLFISGQYSRVLGSIGTGGIFFVVPTPNTIPIRRQSAPSTCQ